MDRPWISDHPANLPDAPAARRNREAILEVLRGCLPKSGVVLEIGSGTGQHALWFATHLPGLVWQPSDPDIEMHAAILAWAAEARAANIRPPLAIDAAAPDWGLGDHAPDLVAIVAINVLQVAPGPAAVGLMAGAGRLLGPGGLLYLYGPFTRAGKHTAPSNESFDMTLRRHDPDWGVPDLDAIAALAEDAGLTLAETVEMPANNLSAIFHRR